MIFLADILLIGGGHVHLSILRALMKESTTHKVTLISSDSFQYYSGMFSGYTEGIYQEEEIRIDLRNLCQQGSVSFIKDTIISLDPNKKVVKGQSGMNYSFGVISFDIGSDIMTKPNMTQIKPNYLFPTEIKAFRSSEKPVLIGGGSAGVELALSILAWRKRNKLKANVTLISSSPLLHSAGYTAMNKIKKVANKKRLTFYENDAVEHINNDTLSTIDGREIEFSAVLPLTGPKASSLFSESSLSTNSKGFLLVEDTLQNKEFPFIFGAGDCVTLLSHPILPKNGLYATKQGPVLWENLKRYSNHQGLLDFKPQKKFLSILSTGDKQGLLMYGSLTLHGKGAWNLKHHIDKKFINKHLEAFAHS